jgi:hypothetical protein
MTPPRRNPVYDLLSFLVGERYKESLNKPTLVKPEAVPLLTDSRREPSPALTQFGEGQAQLERLPGLQSTATSRRPSIESVAPSVISLVTEPRKPSTPLTRSEKQILKTEDEGLRTALERLTNLQSQAEDMKAQAIERLEQGESGILSPGQQGAARILEMAASAGGGGVQKKRGANKKPAKGTPVGTILQTLQEIPEQEAGSTTNVDFR